MKCWVFTYTEFLFGEIRDDKIISLMEAIIIPSKSAKPIICMTCCCLQSCGGRPNVCVQYRLFTVRRPEVAKDCQVGSDVSIPRSSEQQSSDTVSSSLPITPNMLLLSNLIFLIQSMGLKSTPIKMHSDLHLIAQPRIYQLILTTEF